MNKYTVYQLLIDIVEKLLFILVLAVYIFIFIFILTSTFILHL
jgi:hypothetical protein